MRHRDADPAIKGYAASLAYLAVRNPYLPAETVAEFLRAHPEVEDIWDPEMRARLAADLAAHNTGQEPEFTAGVVAVAEEWLLALAPLAARDTSWGAVDVACDLAEYCDAAEARGVSSAGDRYLRRNQPATQLDGYEEVLPVAARNQLQALLGDRGFQPPVHEKAGELSRLRVRVGKLFVQPVWFSQQAPELTSDEWQLLFRLTHDADMDLRRSLETAVAVAAA